LFWNGGVVACDQAAVADMVADMAAANSTDGMINLFMSPSPSATFVA
jgi:hypothetical protein